MGYTCLGGHQSMTTQWKFYKKYQIASAEKKYHSLSAYMGFQNTQEQVKSIFWNPQTFLPKQHSGKLFLRPEVVRKRPEMGLHRGSSLSLPAGRGTWPSLVHACACSASPPAWEGLATTPALTASL